MNLKKNCQRVQSWILMHSVNDLPTKISSHINGCNDCQEFLAQEKQIHSVIETLKLRSIEIPAEQSLKVKQVIWETSQKLANRVPAPNYLFPKVTALIAVFSILLLFFFLPMYQGENYFGYKVNTQFASIMGSKSETYSSVSLKADLNQPVRNLQFASQYVQTTEEKSFYYSNGTLSREEYLLIRFLSNKTNTPPDQIYQLYSKGYASLLRRLNLPYQKTFDEFEAYLNQFKETKENPSFDVDGMILSVNYFTQSIQIDTIPDEILLDPILVNFVYPGKYANFSLKKNETNFSCIHFQESSFPTTILTGFADSYHSAVLTLKNNPSPIQVTPLTYIEKYKDSTEFQSWGTTPLRIRTVIHTDKLTALTISPAIQGTQRTMSGPIDVVYQYGFTMNALQISFCFSSDPPFSITKLKKGTWITITGKDFGKYFIIDSASLIPDPNQTKPNNYYYASAPKLIEKFREEKVDFVVGMDSTSLYLASGKTIPSKNGSFPLGSKVGYAEQNGINTAYILKELGTASMYRSSVGLVKKLENGVCLYLGEKDSRRIFLYPAKGTALPEKGVLQGLLIQYPAFSIMIDYRLFQIKSLTATKGMITREIETGNLFVLDNGMILKRDDWTEVNNGALAVGKTIQVYGTVSAGIIRAYIVSIDREFVLFSGLVITVNKEERYFKLDSGQLIYWDEDTKFSLKKTQIEAGDQIYIRAYQYESRWIAGEVLSSKDGNPDIGEST